MNNPRVQAMFKISRHNNLSIFIISQDYYELPKRTIRANGNMYHIFKPNSFRDVQTLYQDKAFMDMSLNEFNYLTYTCWNKNYQPFTIDMTKDKFTGRYQLLISKICGQVSTIMRAISNKDGDLISHFDNIKQNDIPILEQLADLPVQIRDTPHQKMLINNPTDANKGKMKGYLYLEGIFGFCKTFKKMTKNLGFHLTFKTNDLQNII